MKGVQQPAPHIYDVWEHTLQVLSALDAILAALAPGYDPERTGDLFTGLLVMRLGRYREQFARHLAASLNEDRSLRPLLFFAALYHDVAKPQCVVKDENGRIRFWGHDERGAALAAERARELHLSSDEVLRVDAVIRHHMRLHFHVSRRDGEGKDPSRRAIYRFFRDSGPAGVDICILSLADALGTYGTSLPQETWAKHLDVVRVLLEAWWEKPAESVKPAALVNGHDLIELLGLQPGPTVGRLLEAIREAQATGQVHDREQALALAKEILG